MRIILSLMTCLLCVLPTTAQADTSARILAYFTVGRDEAPATNVTVEQFEEHMRLIKSGEHNVIPLPEIAKANKSNKAFTSQAVAISFDGSDKSIIKTAAPILERYQFPFTVFLAPKRVSSNDPRYLNWDDVKTLGQSELVTFGLHPDNYENLNADNVKVISQNLNNATARFRDNLNKKTKLFSIPHGIASEEYINIIDTYGFDLILGQNSAVYDTKSNWRIAPRFVMTEDYADANRFEMILDALSFEASQITPNHSVIESNVPAIGFTVSDEVSKDLSDLNCFAGSQAKPDIQILGNRVEIRLKQRIKENRFRVNCTLAVKDESLDKSTRWRWLGFLLSPQ